MRFKDWTSSEDFSALCINDMRITKDGEVELVFTEDNIHKYIKSGLIRENKDELSKKTPKNVVKISTGKDFELALGNAKIGKDTLILNMSTAKNCMSAIIGTCKLGPNGCYAARFEKQHEDSLKKNERHEKQWNDLSAKELAEGVLLVLKKINGIKYIRVNEAGEFRNLPSDPAMLASVSDAMKVKLADVDDVKKLGDLGKELKAQGSSVKLYTYTHRLDLKISNLGENVCVNGSGWMLDNAFVPLHLEDFLSTIESAEKKTLKSFNGEKVEIAVHCMGDCRNCHHCKTRAGKHIFLPIHGSGTPMQVAIGKILRKVAKSDSFGKILLSDKSVKEKAKEILESLDLDDKLLLKKLIPLPADREELFEKLLNGKYDVDKAIEILKKYVEAKNSEGKVTAWITEKDAAEAIVHSVESLRGDFKSQITKSLALGKMPAKKKWSALYDGLEAVIDRIKTGKNPKIGKALAHRVVKGAEK